MKCPKCGANHKFLRFEASVIFDFLVDENGWVTNDYDVRDRDDFMCEALCDPKAQLFCTECGSYFNVEVNEDDKVVIKCEDNKAIKDEA